MQNSKQTRDVVNLTGSPTRTSSHYWNAVKEKSPGRKLPWGLCLTDRTKPQQSFLSQAWLCLVSGTEPSLEKDPRLNKLNMPAFFSLFVPRSALLSILFTPLPRCPSSGALHSPLWSTSWGFSTGFKQEKLEGGETDPSATYLLLFPELLDFTLDCLWPWVTLLLSVTVPSVWGCNLQSFWSSLNSVDGSAYHLWLKSLAGPNEFYLNLCHCDPLSHEQRFTSRKTSFEVTLNMLFIY